MSEVARLEVVCTGKGRHRDEPHHFCDIIGPVASESWTSADDFTDLDRRVAYDLERRPQRRAELRAARAAGLVPEQFVDGATFTTPTDDLYVPDADGDMHTYSVGAARVSWEFRCPHLECASLREDQGHRPVRCNELKFQRAVEGYRDAGWSSIDVSHWGA